MMPIPAVVPPLPREWTWKRNVAPAAAFGLACRRLARFHNLSGSQHQLRAAGVSGLRRHHRRLVRPSPRLHLVPGVCRFHGGRSDNRNRTVRKEPAHRRKASPLALWQDDLCQAGIGRPNSVRRRAAFPADAAVDACGGYRLRAVFGLRPFPGLDHIVPMLFTTEVGWAMLLIGSAIGGLFAAFRIRDQCLLHPDAAERAHGRFDRHGHQHGAGLEQSTRHVDLGGHHAGADCCRHRDRTAGNDRGFPGAGTRKLARVPGDAASSLTRGPWSCCRWVVAVRMLD